MPMRVLIVGAGCTGAATAVQLREKLGSDVSITIWEKARGAGGRYTTSRDSYPDGMRADLGAQYSSVDPKDEVSMALMESIVKAGGAEPALEAGLAATAERPAGTVQYRGTSGQNGIVKSMLEMAKAEVRYERRVSKLDIKAGVWVASAYDGASEQFGCVLLCVPGCGPGGDNLNKIHGNWERQLTDAQWKDVEVPHDCRYSVALWIEAGHQKEFEKFFGDYTEKRINKPSVELAIWQSRKDGEPPEGPQVVVVHTPQGARGNKHQAEPRMTGEICQQLGINHRAVKSSKIITWFQSQVLSKTSKTPCMVACSSPPLILAGDYFTSSTFTGCVKSANAAAAEAAKLLGKTKGGASTRPQMPGRVSEAKPQPQATAAQPQAKGKAEGEGAVESRRWGAKPQAAGEGAKPQATAQEAKAKPQAKAQMEFKPPKRDSQQGTTECFCAECKKKSKCFEDKSDGKKYCAPCWKSYYGSDPIAGA
mmetsp:Transcript_73938/g.128244  ORF Transcript_73938/g.128244 Transcript_73938/m.128244 type:complete len:479 (-) Transcript_73938:46-1482(-)